MKYEKLLSEANLAFNSLSPAEIIYSEKNMKERVSPASQRIQAEFYGKKREDLTYEECAILIFENGAISNEAYYYFLPRLAQAVFSEDADEFLFYCHLEKMNRSGLNESQKQVLEKVIQAAKEIEVEFEL